MSLFIQPYKSTFDNKPYNSFLNTTTKGVPVRQVISLDFDWIH
jgi:hypothetical protein